MPSEFQEQSSLITWCDNNASRLPKLDDIFAIPNGGKRDVATGAILKKEGVRPGVPDMFLPVAIGGYYGLFIELKRRDGSGRRSAAQIKKVDDLNHSGYRAVFCDGALEASKEIEFYYSLLS